MLVLRAMLSFLILPGTMAFLVPWLLARGPLHPDGLSLLVPGVLLLLECVREFYARGKGTLAPWDPPKHLVTSGLYRWSRNPMYVAVALVIWGWALAYRSPAIAAYALAVMLAFHLRVVFGEEPWLARTHGEEWKGYRARVRRW
jgi:protein-S-isoprenylcysteine O-methyltransferase Ste14